MAEWSPLVIALDDLHRARGVLESSPHFLRTPMLHHCQRHYGIDDSIDLHLKLENLQVTGSFKIRGVLAQLDALPQGCGTDDSRLITMSAGNYGKAFAFMCHQRGLKGMVVLPETAPMNRVHLIESFGLRTEQAPTSKLMERINKHVADEGMVFLHSYDDPALIVGYGSMGFEIIEDVPDANVVIICCGGGGCIAGAAAAIKLSGARCRIYGVEPQGSRTMHESYRVGHAVSMETKSVASGLSPPSAGENTYKMCKAYVDDILLVSDEEIKAAMFHLYERRLVVEPSGAAAFAALMHKKVPGVTGKKVVVVITGGNVSLEELNQHAENR